ncbi:MAG: hypothetical protein HY744_01550 [Deltaproteobacteria bacterium]|nr:hypothetical protein [Deltaproteobacteria bacterium]
MLRAGNATGVCWAVTLLAALGLAADGCKKSEPGPPAGRIDAGTGAGGEAGAGGGVSGGGGAAKKAKGSACAEPGECETDHCVDGVCCEENCAGLCEVCAKKLGASSDGTCTVASKGVECRAVAGDCDVAELCDGQSAECSADGLVPDGQPSTGEACSPYLCDGLTPTCPGGCEGHEDCAPG